MKKDNLLNIGVVSKMTNASIRALHYYEKIGLLQPTYIDPESNYRYYSYDQIWLIEMIRLCVELGIPTKELKAYIGQDALIDYHGLLAYGQKVAEAKIAQFQKGLKIINDIQDKIATTEFGRPLHEIYTQEFPKKYYRVTPSNKPFSEIMLNETIEWSTNIDYYVEDYSSLLYSELILEYGFLYKNGQNGIERYLFMEVPEETAIQNLTNIIEVPQGDYFVVQHEQGQTRIEETAEIFKEQLQAKAEFLAIEINLYTSRHKVNKPTELRVKSSD